MLPPAGLLRGGVYPLQEEEAAHVVDGIGQTDPRGGLSDAYGSDEQSHLRFLIGKDMLDTRADDRLSSIGSLDMPRHRFEMRLFPVNLGDKVLLFHEVFIGF